MTIHIAFYTIQQPERTAIESHGQKKKKKKKVTVKGDCVSFWSMRPFHFYTKEGHFKSTLDIGSISYSFFT